MSPAPLIDALPGAQPGRVALRADLLDCVADPGWGVPGVPLDDAPGVRVRPDHWLLIDGGRIVGAQPGHTPPDASWHRELFAGGLITPGLIDTHVHAPQLDVIASYGTELLDWLNTYTFVAEQRYADPCVAREGAQRFVQGLLACGTTTAAVFATVHPVSAQALFEQAHALQMRLITGKVLMNRCAPPGLLDDVDGARRDCIELIERWHGHGRQSVAITVRFAPTSTPEQLAMAGELCAAYPGVYLQTHVAENRDEVRWVRELYPEARSYLDVYARSGLIHPRAVFAHGIWLDDHDRSVLRERGAQIAHCPTSNLFLGSGLFDWAQAQGQGVRVSLGSDVGAGTSLSMLRTAAEAYKVQALQGSRLTAWKALHTCTFGAAQALGLDDEIGSLEPGRMADLVVWDWAAGPLAAHRLALAKSWHEKTFAWMMLSDERNVARTYVAGRCVYARSPGAV